jgi:hypothetical protein
MSGLGIIGVGEGSTEHWTELEVRIQTTRSLMNEAVPDCLVVGYEALIWRNAFNFPKSKSFLTLDSSTNFYSLTSIKLVAKRDWGQNRLSRRVLSRTL